MLSKILRIIRNSFLVIFSFFGLYLSNKSKEEQLNEQKKSLTPQPFDDSSDDGDRASHSLYHFHRFKFRKITDIPDKELEEYKEELTNFQKHLPDVPANKNFHQKLTEEISEVDKRITQNKEIEIAYKNLTSQSSEKSLPESQKIKENNSVTKIMPVKTNIKKSPVLAASSRKVSDPIAAPLQTKAPLNKAPIEHDHPLNKNLIGQEQSFKKPSPIISNSPNLNVQPRTQSVIPALAPILISVAPAPKNSKIVKPLPKQTVKPYFKSNSKKKANNFASNIISPTINPTSKPTILKLKETLIASKMIDDDILKSEKIISKDPTLKQVNHLLNDRTPFLPLLIFKKPRIKKLFSQTKLGNRLKAANKKVGGPILPYRHLSFLTLFSKKRTLAKTEKLLQENLYNLQSLRQNLYRNYGHELTTKEFRTIIKELDDIEEEINLEMNKGKKKEQDTKVKKKSLFSKKH